MTVSELKDLYERNNPEGHFFDRKTMRFFGDTMRNFGVADAGEIMSWDDKGEGIVPVPAWELYWKRPVNGGLHGHCAYFRKKDGKEVYNHA
jgi:hypothetical protein